MVQFSSRMVTRGCLMRNWSRGERQNLKRTSWTVFTNTFLTGFETPGNFTETWRMLNLLAFHFFLRKCGVQITKCIGSSPREVDAMFVCPLKSGTRKSQRAHYPRICCLLGRPGRNRSSAMCNNLYTTTPRATGLYLCIYFIMTVLFVNVYRSIDKNPLILRLCAAEEKMVFLK